MKYDNFYEKAAKLTLNANLEQVLYLSREYEGRITTEEMYNTISSYVENRKDLENKFDLTTMSNEIEDLDFFYNILYVIIEKEKYLQNKYNYSSMLINELGEKSIKRLEQMFFEKTGIEKANYLKELDKEYEKFFDNSNFNKKTWFTITTNNCALYRGELYFSDKLAGPIIYDLDPQSSIRGNKVVGVDGKFYTSDDIDPKYIWVINEKKENKPFWKLFSKPEINRSFSLVDKETGKVSSCPLNVPENFHDSDIPRHILNFILYPHKDPFSYDVYNSDFEKIDNKVKYINADYKKGYILVQHHGQNNIQIRDGEYKQIGTITIPIINELVGKPSLFVDEKIYQANDGVIAINTGKRVVYYDYLNDREIDNFLVSDYLMRYSYFAYSEGLYNFIDKNGNHGYKDIDGNVVIKSDDKNQYCVSTPFLHNTASVFKKTKERPVSIFDPNFFAGCKLFVLDKSGNKYSYLDVVDEIFAGSHYAFERQRNYFKSYINHYYEGNYAIRPDFAKQMHRITSRDYVANLIGNEWYVIDNDTPIIEIDFKSKEKVMEKE